MEDARSGKLFAAIAIKDNEKDERANLEVMTGGNSMLIAFLDTDRLLDEQESIVPPEVARVFDALVKVSNNEMYGSPFEQFLMGMVSQGAEAMLEYAIKNRDEIVRVREARAELEASTQTK